MLLNIIMLCNSVKEKLGAIGKWGQRTIHIASVTFQKFRNLIKPVFHLFTNERYIHNTNTASTLREALELARTSEAGGWRWGLL